MGVISVNAFLIGVFVFLCHLADVLIYILFAVIWKIKLLEIGIFSKREFVIYNKKIGVTKFVLGGLPLSCYIRPLGVYEEELKLGVVPEGDLQYTLFDKSKIKQKVFKSLPFLLWLLIFILSLFFLTPDHHIFRNFLAIEKLVMTAVKSLFSNGDSIKKISILFNGFLKTKSYAAFFLLMFINYSVFLIPFSLMLHLLLSKNKKLMVPKIALILCLFIFFGWVFLHLPFLAFLKYIISFLAGLYIAGLFAFFIIIGISFSISRRSISASYRLFTIAFFSIVIVALTECASHSNKSAAPILLFNGTGVSANDVIALETILDNTHFEYATVNSSTLNGMSLSQIMKCRLLIVPGGNFIDMGKSLTTATAVKIRYAVQHGLNYLGICAGGFLAGNSAYYNGFNLTSGVTFGFYAAENKGVRKAAVAISSPDGATYDQYWEDGPQLSGWGLVVAKYPDGSPAVTEGKSGSGFVILTGIHPEAPADWRRGMIFNTPAGTDNAYAAKLIGAVLSGVPLQHY